MMRQPQLILWRLIKSVMSALIDQHRGRVIDSPGDNMLSEFASVVDAVQCARCNSKRVEFQKFRIAGKPKNAVSDRH